MPITQFILTHIPTVALGIIIVAVALLISIGGLLIVRKFVHSNKMKAHHDIAGPMFGSIAVIYAVLLAFVVIISWQDFDRANTDVMKEANCYASLYRDASGFSEPYKSQIQKSVATYTRVVVEEEWPLLAQGNRSSNAHELFTKIWDNYLSFQPQTETEKVFFTESVKKLNEAAELRSQRIMDARSGIHPVLWFILFAGGLINIVFTFFFGSENRWSQIIMSSLFATLIALMLFTTLILDYPYSGDVSIKPDAFNVVLMMSQGK
jgi:hypothetical protein